MSSEQRKGAVPSEADIRLLVKRSLERLDKNTAAPVPAQSRRNIIDAKAIMDLPRHSALDISADTLVTPLAIDAARERNILLNRQGDTSAATPTGNSQRAIALAADHGGYQLKELLKPYLKELGYEVVDLGTHSNESVDYPDFAYAAASTVSQGRCIAAIVIDGAGIGSCMTANKVPGIRASMCYDVSTASNAREHNHANVLTLGAGLIGVNAAREIVKTWLATPWGGARHARRVDKITAVENRFSKK